EPAGPAAGVHADQHPVVPALLELQVRGLDQVGGLHVDEAVPEHVRPEQYLALASLERAQVELSAGELDRLTVEGANLLDRQVHLAAANRGDKAGHHRV